MIMEIGIIAGNIWHYLDENQGAAMFEDMINTLGQSREELIMSLGWLAREGHVVIERNGDYKITLRK